MTTFRPAAVIGIDPGVRGGLAVLHTAGNVLFLRGFHPEMTELELVGIIRDAADMLRGYEGTHAFVEKVGYIRGDGPQGAFTFGKIVGLIHGALLAHGVKIVEVYPQMWQARLECLSGGNKNVTKARAKEMFPSVKMTHLIADALLISEFGRQRVVAGNLLP